MSEEKLEKEPFLTIRIPAVTASLNALFAMNHWQRMKEKKRIQAAFISALQSAGSGYSIQTTASESTQSIASAMLECFQTTVRKMSLLKRGKKKQKVKRRR